MTEERDAPRALRELETAPAAALLLGAAGAVPFVAGAVAAVFIDALRGPALLASIIYGAIILSFLGGIRWGLAVAREQPGTTLDLFISVAPALVAWGALLLPVDMGILILSAGFVAMLVLDLAAVRSGRAPAWYPRLRIPLTVVAVASLAAAALI